MRTFYKHERHNLGLEMLFLFGFVSEFFLRVRPLISHRLVLWSNYNFVVAWTLSLQTQTLSGAAYTCRKLNINPTGAAETAK